MDRVEMFCDFGFMDIGFVNSLVCDKNYVTIYQTLGSQITVKRSSIKKILYNGKEVIYETPPF